MTLPELFRNNEAEPAEGDKNEDGGDGGRLLSEDEGEGLAPEQQNTDSQVQVENIETMSKSKTLRRNKKRNMSMVVSKPVKNSSMTAAGAKRDREFDSETEHQKNNGKRPKIDHQNSASNKKKEEQGICDVVLDGCRFLFTHVFSSLMKRGDDGVAVKPSISTAPSLSNNAKIDEGADDEAIKRTPSSKKSAEQQQAPDRLKNQDDREKERSDCGFFLVDMDKEDDTEEESKDENSKRLSPGKLDDVDEEEEFYGAAREAAKKCDILSQYIEDPISSSPSPNHRRATTITGPDQYASSMGSSKEAEDSEMRNSRGLTIPACRPSSSSSSKNVFAKFFVDESRQEAADGSSSPSNQQAKELEAIMGEVPQRLLQYCLEKEAGADVFQDVVNSLQAIPGGSKFGNLKLLSRIQAVASAFKECFEDGRCGQLKESLEDVPNNFLGSAEVLQDLTIRAQFLADAGDLKKKKDVSKHDDTWKRFSELVDSGIVPEAVDLTESLEEFLKKNDVAIDFKREAFNVNLTLLEKKVLSKVKALLESLLVPPLAQGQFSPCTTPAPAAGQLVEFSQARRHHSAQVSSYSTPTTRSSWTVGYYSGKKNKPDELSKFCVSIGGKHVQMESPTPRKPRTRNGEEVPQFKATPADDERIVQFVVDAGNTERQTFARLFVLKQLEFDNKESLTDFEQLRSRYRVILKNKHNQNTAQEMGIPMAK